MNPLALFKCHSLRGNPREEIPPHTVILFLMIRSLGNIVKEQFTDENLAQIILIIIILIKLCSNAAVAQVVERWIRW